MSDDIRVVLSATALRITPGEHRALLEVRDMFAKGTFKHDPHGDADHADGFNMEYPKRTTDCGTTCCIGGWVWAVMDRDRATTNPSAGRYVRRDKSYALGALYYPDQGEIDDMAYSDITPGAALAAIDSFLATGNPDWYRACGFHLVEDQLA